MMMLNELAKERKTRKDTNYIKKVTTSKGFTFILNQKVRKLALLCTVHISLIRI